MTTKHQTGLLYNKFAGIFILKLQIFTVCRDILSIYQLHILLSRTAQSSLELHFCVELHTKKALPQHIQNKSLQQVVQQKASRATSWTTCRTASPQQIHSKLHATISKSCSKSYNLLCNKSTA